MTGTDLIAEYINEIQNVEMKAAMVKLDTIRMHIYFLQSGQMQGAVEHCALLQSLSIQSGHVVHRGHKRGIACVYPSLAL